MNFAVTILIFCFVGIFAAPSGPVKVSGDCLAEYGIELGDFTPNNKHNLSDDQIDCAVACGLKILGIINPDGTYNITAAEKYYADKTRELSNVKTTCIELKDCALGGCILLTINNSETEFLLSN